MRFFNDAERRAALRLGITEYSLKENGADYWQDRLHRTLNDASVVLNALARQPAESKPDSSPAPLDVESFNAAHPVGTDVIFWPGARHGAGRRSKTRSPAWELCGHAVVTVEDYSGGIALTHVETLDGPPRDTIEESTLGGPAGVAGYVYRCTDCGWSKSEANPVLTGPCPLCQGRMSRRWTENP